MLRAWKDWMDGCILYRMRSSDMMRSAVLKKDEHMH
jgi:hypothetical protein